MGGCKSCFGCAPMVESESYSRSGECEGMGFLTGEQMPARGVCPSSGDLLGSSQGWASEGGSSSVGVAVAVDGPESPSPSPSVDLASFSSASETVIPATLRSSVKTS